MCLMKSIAASTLKKLNVAIFDIISYTWVRACPDNDFYLIRIIFTFLVTNKNQKKYVLTHYIYMLPYTVNTMQNQTDHLHCCSALVKHPILVHYDYHCPTETNTSWPTHCWSQYHVPLRKKYFISLFLIFSTDRAFIPWHLPHILEKTWGCRWLSGAPRDRAVPL